MNRETQKLTLPSGKILTVCSYITARDMKEGGEAKDNQKFLVDKLVVEMNGQKEGFYEMALDLPLSDYRVLDNYLLGLVRGDDVEEGVEATEKPAKEPELSQGKKKSLKDTSNISQEKQPDSQKK